jgi:homocysteine S-methyltransferase
MPSPANGKYRQCLPQLDGGLFLTDGGLETTLIFHEGWELPIFQAYSLLEAVKGRAALRAYFDTYIQLALTQKLGFLLESPTWRANPDWAAKIGHGRDTLAKLNHAAIDLMAEVRETSEAADTPMVISGCIGARGDGYDPGRLMDADEAQEYHAWQVGVLGEAGVDLVSAFTMNNVNEALGVARAARDARLPCVISFTVETDGRLPTGDSLQDAIKAVDAGTEKAPAYYMLNCAHPTHFANALQGGDWLSRLRGVRANSSRRSHAELDNATELDTGNPAELGQQYAELRRRFPHINVLGGCCGTDHRHAESISLACRLPG